MEYLTAKEVMEKFKVHRNTITNWMKNNGMPYYKIGETLRFNEREVIQWFESNKQNK